MLKDKHLFGYAITKVYGSQSDADRQKFWDQLGTNRKKFDGAWVVDSAFYMMQGIEDRKKGFHSKDFEESTDVTRVSN